MINNWDRYATVTRPDTTNNDSSGGDYDFGDDAEPGPGVILTDYPCSIDESVQYDTSEKGESFTGRAKMKGMLTDKLQKNDIIDGHYKIITKPKEIHGRYIQCQVVRLG